MSEPCFEPRMCVSVTRTDKYLRARDAEMFPVGRVWRARAQGRGGTHTARARARTHHAKSER